MDASDFVVTPVRVETDKPYGQVIRDFESGLGRYDPAASEVPVSGSPDVESFRGRIVAMAGLSGLMTFWTIDHGALLSLMGEPRRSVQYGVGNPLVAVEMTRHDLGAGLYAPLRVLVSEDEVGRTCVEYDLPSSLFGRFGDERITQVARTLDHELGVLVAAATGVEVGLVHGM